MQKVRPINFKSLKLTFNAMDNDKGMLGLSLIKEAEFMKTTLSKLKTELKKGVVTKMCQGSYEIDRANPALTQYNSLIKNYQSCIKQIADLLPSTEKSIEDEFDDFNK